MANFKEAFDLVIKNEGGYVNDPDDAGGETYKGVARKMNSNWPGWIIVDLLKRQPNFPSNLNNNIELQDEIERIYKINYWDKLRCDRISDQRVANTIFDFGVNAGTSTAAILAQKVVNEKEDGVLGEKSITGINQMEPDKFLAFYTIVKIARYIQIVKSRPTNQKYFYGCVRRALGQH